MPVHKVVVPKENFDTYIAKGMQLISKKDYEEAIRNFTLALKINPMDQDVLFHLGICNLKIGDRHKALHYFDRITWMDPYHYMAWFRKAEIFDDISGP